MASPQQVHRLARPGGGRPRAWVRLASDPAALAVLTRFAYTPGRRPARQHQTCGLVRSIPLDEGESHRTGLELLGQRRVCWACVVPI
jgi:hypothetical protein